MPRTGLEPARLSTLAPETSASTIPPPGHLQILPLSGKRGSNSRPQPWQGCALPTELFPHFQRIHAFATRIGVLQTKITFSQRAENEARTRDPTLGKVVLYQLSYFRVRCRYSLVLFALPRLEFLTPWGKVVLYQLSCSANYVLT